MPVGGDSEDSRTLGEQRPERALAAAQAPAGLVDVDCCGETDVAEQLLVGEGERLAGAAYDRLDRAGRDVGAEQVARQLGGIAAGDAVPDRERRDRGL